MPDHQVEIDSLEASLAALPSAATPIARHISIGARLAARLFAGRFDRVLAVSAAVPQGAAAAHAKRLTSHHEREALARALHSLRGDPADGLLSFRVPAHRENIASAAALIDEVTRRLQGLGLVTPRGVARLRLLMSDGTGPLYLLGRGDLTARLGAILAAL
ncbi:MAG: hypothetical protein JWR37_5846 [Mycobacterium sp.]|jgi:hypothetical protein|nr:hypothetical protein [Mycobacterium sp.]